MDNKHNKAYEVSLQVFLDGNQKKMAELSLSTIDDEYLYLPYLGDTIKINRKTGEIDIDLYDEYEAVWIYQYLTEVCGFENQNPNFISFLQLPQGSHHNDPFDYEAHQPIAKAFGDNLDLFEKQALLLGGISAKGGDMSFIFPYFAKISLQVIIWARDDEFSAKAVVLFDDKCHMHLTTAALYGIGINLAMLLINGR